MQNNLIIVTGLSGAGMSSALKALEDNGYEVLDNFPISLIDDLLKEKSDRPLAIGIDSRTRNFRADELQKAVKTYNAYLIFMNCKHSVLQKRYTETRRKHPLAQDRPVSDGINKEIEIMEPLKASADMVVDSTEKTIHDLRRLIDGRFALAETKKMAVSLLSFGFRNGIPRGADIVMDVRFLKNPHWDENLKPLTGQTAEVGAYIQTDESFAPFIQNFQNMVEPLLERYNHEGKSYLTIAIGCTGGKHRSVFTVETLKKWFAELDITAHVNHRDMPV